VGVARSGFKKMTSLALREGRHSILSRKSRFMNINEVAISDRLQLPVGVVVIRAQFVHGVNGLL